LVDRALVVSINQTFPGRSLYDAARFAWLVSPARVAGLDYVIATKNRQIVGVFVPAEWKRATRENFPEFDMDLPTRLGFIGANAPREIRDRYVGKHLPPDFEFAGTGMRYCEPRSVGAGRAAGGAPTS
jgi:hypothetical protein